MYIDEIDREIHRLQNLKNERVREYIEEHQEEAKKNVGRCFEIFNGRNTIYARVIAIPQKEETRTGVDYNEYIYKALFINQELELPLYIGSIHSSSWTKGEAFYKNKVMEISLQKFELEFDKAIVKLRRNYLK